MSKNTFRFQMFKPIILILLSLATTFGSSCYERNRISSLVDMAVDVLSKVKLETSSCPKDGDSTCSKPLDCAELYTRGYNKSGVYSIWPINRVTFGKRVEVYCDMTDGGWTVIQRRGDFGRPDNFFDQDWETYRKGFGDLVADFWLGNDNIFAITNQKHYSVRFDLKDNQGNKASAHYDSFWIDDESHKYALHISGFRGKAGDSLSGHNNKKFTTKDRDDVSLSDTECGIKYKNGWWFMPCYHSNLNGLYNSVSNGIIWHAWKNKMEALPWTEIKVKPAANF